MEPTELDQATSIPQAFFATAAAQPQSRVYRYPIVDNANPLSANKREWVAINYQQTSARILAVANYLISIGVQKGDRIAILSNSRPEWMEADLGSLAAGAVVVSIYQSIVSQDVGYILHDSGAQIVFAENQEQVDKLLELTSRTIAIPATEDRAALSVQLSLKKIIAFEQTTSHPLVVQFQQLEPGTLAAEKLPYHGLARADLAALVYTSGTTGPPKGVMQSHGNHLSNVRQAFQSKLFGSDSSLMLVLPLAHSFARLIGYIGYLTPAELMFAGVADKRSSKPNPDSVTKDIREANATIVPVVPRLLEKMQSGVQSKGQKPGVAGWLVATTLKCAEAVYFKRASISDRILYVFTKGIRNKIRVALFGKRLHYLVSGGAKLAVPTNQFFDSLGIPILEGYGLTETVVATNVNRIWDRKIGSVGPVLAADVEISFGNDREILFRGPNVALGYYNRPTATKEAWDAQGWFHTGDLGSLDERGFLTIEGRKKELIVTSNGKKIPPDSIEQQMKGSPFLSQVLLYGDERPYCVALATLNIESVRAWARSRGIASPDFNPYTDSRVRELISAHFDKVNSKLASFESIKKFALIEEDFTIENGLLTPTFKVKRKEVIKRYRSTIDALYDSKV